MEALWLASPSLAREAERWRDGEKAPGTSQLLGLLRYLIRATTRPTPFGLFAGVAFVPIEEQTRLRLAGLGSHQKRARLDYGQALAFVQSLERDPALRSELYVYANPALLRWYSRIRVTCRDGYGRGQDPGQAWIRLTDPVQVILEIRCSASPVWRLNPPAARALPTEFRSRYRPLPAQTAGRKRAPEHLASLPSPRWNLIRTLRA